ncbi:MAG: hypothetical protein ACQCN4_13480 [Candidatus Bathyarchaeia archaeon]|jgi:outer membrane protein assembly factor BamB
MANRKTAILIALFTMLTMTVSLIPTSLAQFGTQVNTMTAYAFVGARPNPVGVGQEVLIHFGITAPTQNATESYKGITVTITKPDNTTVTLGPFTTDSTGGSGTIYIPETVGEYTLQTHFPAQWYNFSGTGTFGPVNSRTYYSASDSEKLTLIVQEDPIPQYPAVPLPTEYWTRPIDSQNRAWYTISGSWLYASGGLSGSDVPNRLIFNNDDAPDTAHILWTTPLTMGGLVGGDVGITTSSNQGPVGFGTGDAYEGVWSSRLILAGKLYYATYAQGMLSSTTAQPVIYHCVDLHTGKELWAKTFLNNQSIAFGQELYYQGFNYMGAFSYLWVTTGGYSLFGYAGPATWYAFDAYTGNWAFTIKNPPSGTLMRDENGALHILVIDQTNGWMADWNMTAFIEASATGYYVGGGSWGNVVNGMTFDAGANTQAAKEAYSWNVTIPKNLPGSVQAAYFNDRVVGSNLGGGFGASAAPSTVSMWGISLKDGQEGQVLFNKQWASPSHWVSGNETISWATFSEQSKIGILWSKELRQHYGVSLETGDLIWGPTPSQYYLDIYEGSVLTSHLVAYDKLYACGVAGILYCYDVKTGDLLWNYSAKDPYTESMFSSNWWIGITFITDGKLYIGSGEHSPNQPLPRGAPFLCLNATNGDVVWRVNGLFRQTGWGGLAIIGDSIMATMDTYDMRLYAVGKGPTAMTVSAPENTQEFGAEVLVKGTVMDISPGTKEDGMVERFPNGVPAVSDECQSDWMLYTYKQFARPTNATGVPVVISVFDPNNNIYEVGTTTSDSAGFYSFAFTPEVPGKYTVIASFPGSAAYYGSSAETAINVAQEPAPTSEPSQAPVSLADQYILPGIIGIIVAIVIVGLVLGLLVTRKRP